MMFNQIRSDVEPISDEKISMRAYELWQARGCPDGDGEQDWQQAKEQLLAETQPTHRRKPIRRLLARLRNRAAI